MSAARSRACASPYPPNSSPPSQTAFDHAHLLNDRHLVFKHLQHKKQLADAADKAEQERRKQADPQTGSGKRPAGASLLALRKAPRT